MLFVMLKVIHIFPLNWEGWKERVEKTEKEILKKEIFKLVKGLVGIDLEKRKQIQGGKNY